MILGSKVWFSGVLNTLPEEYFRKWLKIQDGHQFWRNDQVVFQINLYAIHSTVLNLLKQTVFISDICLYNKLISYQHSKNGNTWPLWWFFQNIGGR